MGMKKPWIYDNNLPDALAEELNAEGFGRPSSPGVRETFEEKQKAMEMHSLSASGDLVSEKEHEWTRISVAARASQLRTRMRKLQAKSRRSASVCLGEDARCELGLSDYRACSSLDKAGEAKDREMSRRFSYPAPHFPSLEDKTVKRLGVYNRPYPPFQMLRRLLPLLAPKLRSNQATPPSSPHRPSKARTAFLKPSLLLTKRWEKAQVMMRCVRSEICSPHKSSLGFPSNRLRMWVLATCETRRFSSVLTSTSL
ncbi:hypothetical protein ACEPAH_7149 [Sanghuangporus vaninii]